MEYARKNAAARAEKNKIVCKTCKKRKKEARERACPSCSCPIIYKTYAGFKKGEESDALCPSCAKLTQYEARHSIKCSECSGTHFVKREETLKKMSKMSQPFICGSCKKKARLSIVYSRDCVTCGKSITYKNKYNYNASIKRSKKARCASCARTNGFVLPMERPCPKCNKIIHYKTKDSCARANKHDSFCKSCALSGRMPSDRAIEAARKARIGRVASPEELKRKEATLLEKYGAKSYLGTDAHRRMMVDSGAWKDYDGKTIKQIANENGLPESVHSSLYKWVASSDEISYDDIAEYCSSYEKKISNLENLASLALGIDHFNKKISEELPYRPDFKISDKIFLNVDGLYWHSELHSDRKYHFDMRKSYEEAGLRIIQFREDEVNKKMHIIKSMIDNASGLIKSKIGARKCKIAKPTTDEAESFLRENHIKGYITSRHLGLYYNDQLVSLMSYKLRKSYVKIDRFCSKAGWSVQGGFSRLFKEVERQNDQDLPIHYWVDLRYGTGDFLLSQGFKLEKETLGWEWTDFKKTHNRLKCRANMDDRCLSQSEHAKELGLFKIYDAGQRLYIKNK